MNLLAKQQLHVLLYSQLIRPFATTFGALRLNLRLSAELRKATIIFLRTSSTIDLDPLAH